METSQVGSRALGLMAYHSFASKLQLNIVPCADMTDNVRNRFWRQEMKGIDIGGHFEGRACLIWSVRSASVSR